MASDDDPPEQRRPPEHLDDDDYVSTAGPKTKRGMPIWGWLLIAGGVLVLLCGGLGVVGFAMFAWRSERAVQENRAADQQLRIAPEPIRKNGKLE